MNRELFEEVSARFFAQLEEQFFASLWLAKSTCEFVRFNRSQVRQAGNAQTQTLYLTLAKELRPSDFAQAHSSIEWVGDKESLLKSLAGEYETLKQHLLLSDSDPFFLVNHEPMLADISQDEATDVQAIDIAESLFRHWPQSTECGELAELVGFAASGDLVSALAIGRAKQWSSRWQQSPVAWAEYSLHVQKMPEGYGRALRCLLAFTSGQTTLDVDSKVGEQFVNTKRDIQTLSKPLRTLSPGKYRCLFKPLAVADLLQMFSWSACSYSALQRGHNPLRTFWEGSDRFHSSIDLKDDPAALGLPLFNAAGFELAGQTTLVHRGEPGKLLVSPRSSKEFSVPYAGGPEIESPRALVLGVGGLAEKDELLALGTGILVTNVWYLNWSDQESGRVTGMTRDAAYWVEDGEIREAIVNVRFDARLVELFGSHLEALGDTAHRIPSTTSYDQISNAATVCPSLLVRDVNITL